MGHEPGGVSAVDTSMNRAITGTSVSPSKRLRYVLDASVMAAVINMDDPAHQSCYWFFENLHAADRVTWVVPGLIFFELQAVRARRKRDQVEDRPPYKTGTDLFSASPRDSFLLLKAAVEEGIRPGRCARC